MIRSDIIKDELLFLAKEEDKHREIIERMAERFIGERTEAKKINIDIIGEFQVIAEKMGEAIRKPDINIDEIYDVAMQAELVSEKLYRELADYAATEKTRLILEMLADMEMNHYNIIRKQYEYITRYPDIYRAEFYDQLMKDINFNF